MEWEGDREELECEEGAAYKMPPELGEDGLMVPVKVEVLRDLGSLAQVVEGEGAKEGFNLAKLECEGLALDQQLYKRPVAQKRSVSTAHAPQTPPSTSVGQF